MNNKKLLLLQPDITSCIEFCNKYNANLFKHYITVNSHYRCKGPDCSIKYYFLFHYGKEYKYLIYILCMIYNMNKKLLLIFPIEIYNYIFNCFLNLLKHDMDILKTIIDNKRADTFYTFCKTDKSYIINNKLYNMKNCDKCFNEASDVFNRIINGKPYNVCHACINVYCDDCIITRKDNIILCKICDVRFKNYIKFYYVRHCKNKSCHNLFIEIEDGRQFIECKECMNKK